MFFRVRTTLTERPGALALLATRCGEAGLNIMGLQIFPDLGRVTDELVMDAPAGWTAGAVADLVSGAGGGEVSVEPCTTHDLVDQPMRWLAAAHDVAGDPDLLSAALERLLGPHPERWSATEHSRAEALGRFAERAGGPPVAQGEARAGQVAYVETASGVVARIGGHVVGAAAFAPTPGRELTVSVAPAWRRLGIGTTLLVRSVAQAAADGVGEVVLLAPPDDEGLVTMVCNAGLRARIKVSEGMLQARISVTGVRPAGPATPVPPDVAVVPHR